MKADAKLSALEKRIPPDEARLKIVTRDSAGTLRDCEGNVVDESYEGPLVEVSENVMRALD